MRGEYGVTEPIKEQLRRLMDGIGPGEDATPDMLEVTGIVKRYGDLGAVNGLDLRVPRGEIFGFLGPNGAGKTTTIRMIAGVLEPTEGSIVIGGYDLETHPMQAKSRIGYIPDRPFLYEKLSGGEFLRFVSGIWGKDEPASEERADGLLEIFNLLEWKHELIETYSHGMRQKLLITSALIHQPELIVVDEPMVGLDPRSARILKDLFRVYVERGGTVFLSSHTLEIVEAVCDRIAIIREGVIIAKGTMDDLRLQVDSGGADLEEIFLKVTGSGEMAEVVASLQESVS
jgi:ABC-2 type transport system ATP-binding protein